jgi:DNA ligase-1
MNDFANLIKEIDKSNKTNAKVLALDEFFTKASDEDKVWAIALFSSKRPKRAIKTSNLREYAAELANIPLWLFEESYHIVGDLAETIALVVPDTKNKFDYFSLSSIIKEIKNLKNLSELNQKEYLFNRWNGMDYYSKFVFNKLITGGFRIGVSQKLMTKSLANVTGIDRDTIAYQIMGNWDPEKISYNDLILSPPKEALIFKPFPFYLAYSLDTELENIGDPNEWIFENKWDGIRAQIVKRSNQVLIWSRGEELISNQFPELIEMGSHLIDGTVIDGEILPFKDGAIKSFNDLQKRLGRKNVSKSIINNNPVILKAYDLLENKGLDIRNQPYSERRLELEELISKTNNNNLQLSDFYSIKQWEELRIAHNNARLNKSEGLMIKNKSAIYKVGRKKGDWWKWKVDPLTIDAVLTYAMRGHGRRANLFTDYTFGLWRENESGEKELVTFAKAYSGLTDKEFKEIDAFIKKNTLEKFGPVRSVVPNLVFEIAFEGAAFSSRHKSGVSVRFPRILRWRRDKTIEQANSISSLKAFVNE